MTFIANTGIPNIPPNPLQDALSLGIQEVRSLINKQRRYPAPTDEELRRKQQPYVRPSTGTSLKGSSNEIPNEFDNRVDIITEEGFSSTDQLEQAELGFGPITETSTEKGKLYKTPADRIDRDILIIEPISGRVAKLPFVPKELSINPDSSFKTIASMGRNNPFYHFTGSEDSIEFEIDWFAQEESRLDVIRNCKLIESWSKNDAYNNPPPAVILHWNSKLFSSELSLWLITAAPYRLKDFQAHRSMLPQQAYQQITMKRVTLQNLSRNEIQNITI